jgi:hypothetical protein
MHVQLVTFGLNGITEEQYRQACEGETATFAGLPGLICKIWLRDAKTTTYGGLYLWRDRRAYESYVAGEIFHSIKDDPTLTAVASRDFGVFEELTAATQPGLERNPPRGRCVASGERA